MSSNGKMLYLHNKVHGLCAFAVAALTSKTPAGFNFTGDSVGLQAATTGLLCLEYTVLVPFCLLSWVKHDGNAPASSMLHATANTKATLGQHVAALFICLLTTACSYYSGIFP